MLGPMRKGHFRFASKISLLRRHLCDRLSVFVNVSILCPAFTLLAHIRGNNLCVFEDREDLDDLFGEESKVNDDDSDGGDSIEGESTRSLIAIPDLYG